MPTLDLHHVNLRVPANQLTMLRDFYIDILELQDGPRPSVNSIGHWLYAGERAIVHLVATREEAAASAPPAKGMIDHVAFACSGFHEMCVKLESKSIRFKIMELPGLEQKQLFFRDPLGNGIELNYSESESAA